MYRYSFIISLTLCFLIENISIAQQFSQFSLIEPSIQLYNPSQISFKKTSELILGHRTQWSNYSSSIEYDRNPRPLSQYLTIKHPFSIKGNVDEKMEAFGLNILNDNVGLINQLRLSLLLNKSIRLSTRYSFNLGLSSGFVSQSLRSNDFVYLDVDDPIIEELLSRSNTVFTPQLQFGLSIQSQNTSFGIAYKDLISANKSLFFKSEVFSCHYISQLNLRGGFSVKPNFLVLFDTEILSFTYGCQLIKNVNGLPFVLGLLTRQSMSDDISSHSIFSFNDINYRIE